MSEGAKITGFSIQDFKRVKLVEIQPTANGLTILGGRNAQGKSSCLDAIAYALGGEAFRPSDINNHEAEKNAAIRVEINGLIVERAGKNAALKITDARGMRGNQTILNDIVGKFALDLGSFMRASDTDKAKLLLKMFPELEANLAELKTQADGIRASRADNNRDRKRLQAQFDAMPNFPEAPAQEINISELAAELQKVTEEETETVAVKCELQKMIAEDGSLKDELNAKKQAEESRHVAKNHLEVEYGSAATELEHEFERRKAELKQIFADRAKKLDEEIASLHNEQTRIQKLIVSREESEKELSESLSTEPDYTAVKAEIMTRRQQADERNRQIRANAERAKVYDQMVEVANVTARQTRELEDIENRRTAMLQKAELPMPELSITEDGELLYRGQKWDCMSGSERLKVATGICMKSKPGCGFVLIDGLEAMDAQTLAEFAEFLTEQNMQGIGTIVGENSATVIIEDGKVKENTPTTADHNTNRK